MERRAADGAGEAFVHEEVVQCLAVSHGCITRFHPSDTGTHMWLDVGCVDIEWRARPEAGQGVECVRE